MLRKRNILICLTAVTFCFAGTVPAKACGDWNLIDWGLDSNDNLWMLWWNWFDWSCLLEYIEVGDGDNLVTPCFGGGFIPPSWWGVNPYPDPPHAR
jgi:hypothetical protein